MQSTNIIESAFILFFMFISVAFPPQMRYTCWLFRVPTVSFWPRLVSRRLWIVLSLCKVISSFPRDRWIHFTFAWQSSACWSDSLAVSDSRHRHLAESQGHFHTDSKSQWKSSHPLLYFFHRNIFYTRFSSQVLVLIWQWNVFLRWTRVTKKQST